MEQVPADIENSPQGDVLDMKTLTELNTKSLIEHSKGTDFYDCSTIIEDKLYIKNAVHEIKCRYMHLPIKVSPMNDS